MRTCLFLATLSLFAVPCAAQESFDLVSISMNGSYGNGISLDPSVSANGRFVAFGSLASDLVPGDTNGNVDVFVRDLDLGVTARVSLSNSGTQLAWANSGTVFVSTHETVGISRDGSIVSFVSSDPSVVPGDTNGTADVFVRNRALGTTARVSIRPDGGEFAGHCAGCQISSDGTRALFAHRPPGASAAELTWYVRDLAAGTTQLVSVDPSGGHNLSIYSVQLAAGGRWVVFSAGRATAPHAFGTFVRDIDAGTTQPLTQRSGWRNWDLPDPQIEKVTPMAISASGGFVLCWSHQDLDPLDGLDVGYEDNAWVLDRSTGRYRLATRRVAHPGLPFAPAIESLQGYGFVSDDGRFARLNVYGGSAGLLDPHAYYDGNFPTFYELDLETTETRVLSLNWHMRPFVGGQSWTIPFGSSEDGATIAMTGIESEYWFPFRFWGPTDFDQVFVRRVRGSAGTTVCAGDGTGASCPCGTTGISGRGCANAFTSRGAELSTRGNASLADDTLTLIAYEATPGMSVLLQSSSAGAVGGVPFEGGVLCVGSPALRIALDDPVDDLGVVKLFGRGAYFGHRLHEIGGITAPGTRYYQVWTRAVGGASCIASRSSLTNGVRVEWRL